MDWTRTIQLVGDEAFARLQQVRVILFGVGGVGGWCAETLVRTGIRHLTIVDFDTIADSNINRQIVATAANTGCSKVEEMRKRLLAINPQADIVAINRRLTAENAHEWFTNNNTTQPYDYIIDAIDSVEDKAHLIYRATQTSAVLFSSMGAGRKTDTEQIRISEFRKVEGCPLARALRTKMKKNNLLPEHKFLCVWSPEISSESGTIAPIVGIFGMKIANLLIRDIIQKQHNIN